MSIPKAFLALLHERPMNGNQLKSEFEARTGDAWPLNVGQAYTTLQRLERDDLIAPDTEPGHSETYRLTAAGDRELTEWWRSPVERSRPARDELAIKLTLAVTVPGVDVPAVVRVQRTESMRMLHEYTRLKVEATTDAARGDLSWRLLVESLIFQTEAEIRWLGHVEATVLRESGTTASATPASPPASADAASAPAPERAR